MTTPLDSQFCYATEHGANGPYLVGIEYAVVDGVHHVIRRPVRRRRWVAYAVIDGVETTVSAWSHVGAMSEWRCADHDGTARVVVDPPMSSGCLNLPDEEHGNTWGDPIDVPSTESIRYMGGGGDLDEATVRAGIAAYVASVPEAWQREILLRETTALGMS